MNIRDLEYFVVLAQVRNFHRAAEQCFVSQPTLSGQLKKLEEELGVTLFERQQKGLILTDAGDILLTKAKEIVSNVKQLQDLAQTLRDPKQGPLRMGVIPTLAPYLTPYIVEVSKKVSPKIQLFVSELQTQILMQKLRSGDVQAGFLARLSGDDQDNHFEWIDLFDENFLLAVPHKHSLVKQGKLSLSDMNGLDLYLLEDGHCLKGQALEICAQSGANENPDFRASSLETLRQMIASGNGITLMPHLAATGFMGNSKYVKYLPFEEPSPRRTIALVWRKGGSREKFFQVWAKAISDRMQKVLANENQY